MKVRLKDIAQRSGLSLTAVSRALADKKDIGEETKEKVRKLAREMGYVPNRTAQNMATGRSRTIGILVSQLYNPVRSEFCIKFNNLLHTRGYRLLLYENDQASWPQLFQHDLDAVIAGMVILDEQAQELEKQMTDFYGRDFPLVFFGNTRSSRADMVILDMEKNGFLLGEHLIRNGCRSLAVLSHTRHSNSRREAGVLRALETHGLPEAEFILYAPDAVLSEVYETTARWLKTTPRLPDGIVFHDDLRGFAALAALRDAGIRVPEDCLAASFDNLQQCEYFSPRLSSIGFDNNTLIETLWELTSRRLENKTAEKRILSLDSTLHIRESSTKKTAR